MERFAVVRKAIMQGNGNLVKQEVGALLAEDITPAEIIQSGLMSGMNEVGVRFKAEDMFVPEVMMSAKAMKTGMELLKPLMNGEASKSEGIFMIGTVRGDLHDIGKNLVSMLIESAGFTVIDLGIDVTEEEFVKNVQLQKPDILGLSALLTTTMANMSSTLKALQDAGLRKELKVLVGGAPVSVSFAQSIGADGYASDAQDGVQLCKKFMAEKMAVEGE